MPTSRYLYWDSSVFAGYIGQEPDRVDVIQAVWDDIAQHRADRIVTVTLSVAEVIYVATEQIQTPPKPRRILDPQAEAKLEAIWEDPSVYLVDPPIAVMRMARDLMRKAVPHGWVLKPYDAIQLATAQWVHENFHQILAVHTYDDWKNYEQFIGIPISKPQVLKSTQLTLLGEGT
jgi:predicted nucleic acid-binding protein